MNHQTTIDLISRIETSAHKLFPAYMAHLGVKFFRTDFDRFFELISPIFNKVFTTSKGEEIHYFPGWKDPLLRQSFLQRHAEYQVIFSQDKPVGWLTGDMHDAETFHIKNAGVLPEYQNRGIIGALLDYNIQYLGDLGYQRITAAHDPENAAVVRLMLSKGFFVSGVEMDHRFGSLVTTLYILNSERRRIAESQLGNPKDVISWPLSANQSAARPHDRAGLSRLLKTNKRISGYLSESSDCWVLLKDF